jgi:hypothetical protein
MIPVRELWEGLHPLGFDRGTFMVLRGYIDESGEGNLFTLSCLIADSPAWFYMELDWLKCIEKKNAELIASGRKPISRYHAADCSSRLGEFVGWDVEKDQLPFVKELLAILEQYRMDVVAYTIDLKELVKYIPYAKNDPVKFAHVMLLHYIIMGIEHGSLQNNRDALIGLIHDRSSYDSVLLDAFNLLVNDPEFSAAKRFTTIAPMCWQHSVSLQAADLMAYENFKESQRCLVGRKRRKSLEVILERGQLGGFLRGFDKETLIKYKEHIDNLHPHAKALFMAAARVPNSLWSTDNENEPRVSDVHEGNGHNSKGESRRRKSRDGSGEKRTQTGSPTDGQARTGETA